MRRLYYPKPLLLRSIGRAALFWPAAHLGFLIVSKGAWRLALPASVALIAVVAVLTWHDGHRSHEDLWQANLASDARLSALVGGMVALLGEIVNQVVA